MKPKRINFSLIMIFVFVLISCGSKGINSSNSSTYSSQVIQSKSVVFDIEPNMEYDSKKEKELIRKKYDIDTLNFNARFVNYINGKLTKVSPKEVEDDYDINIFHYDASGKSYLIYENEAFQLEYEAPNYYPNKDDISTAHFKSAYGAYNFYISGNKNDFTLYTISHFYNYSNYVFIYKFESKDKKLSKAKEYFSEKLCKFKIENDVLRLYESSNENEMLAYSDDRGVLPFDVSFLLADKKMEESIELLEFYSEDNSLFRTDIEELKNLNLEEEIKKEGSLLYRINKSSNTCGVIALHTYNNEEVVIPEKYKDMEVTTIYARAFGVLNFNIKKIVLPNTIIKIEDNAFYNLINLEDIILPDSLKYIGDNCFNGCKKLKTITIPKSLNYLGKYVFDNTNFESLNVDSQNEKYADCGLNAIIDIGTETLLYGCKNTIIGDEIKHIGEHAFYGNSGIRSLIISDSVISIGLEAISNCSNLEEIVIGDSVNIINPIIGTKIKKISINQNNVTYSDYGANVIVERETNKLIFSNGIIPEGVEVIAGHAIFEQEIENLVFPSSLRRIDASAIEMAKIKNIVLNNNLMELSSLAFSSSIIDGFSGDSNNFTLYDDGHILCDKNDNIVIVVGKKVTIPNYIKVIPNNSISLSVEELYLSKSIEKIETNALASSKIKKLIFDGTYEELLSIAKEITYASYEIICLS